MIPQFCSSNPSLTGSTKMDGYEDSDSISRIDNVLVKASK